MFVLLYCLCGCSEIQCLCQYGAVVYTCAVCVCDVFMVAYGMLSLSLSLSHPHPHPHICTHTHTTAFLPASVMLPPRRLRQLLSQAVQLQVDRCPFHYVEQSTTEYCLLTDHMCSRYIHMYATHVILVCTFFFWWFSYLSTLSEVWTPLLQFEQLGRTCRSLMLTQCYPRMFV